MKGKLQGEGVTGNVLGSTLAYPGNCFIYSPKFPNDEPQQKLSLFDITVPTLKSAAATPSITVGSNSTANGSVVLSSTEQTLNKLCNTVSDAVSPQRRSRLPSLTCDEIYSLSGEDILGTDGQNQGWLQTDKSVMKFLQKVDKDIQEIDHSCKEHTKEVNNGLKKIDAKSSMSASERF